LILLVASNPCVMVVAMIVPYAVGLVQAAAVPLLAT
jgi:hypothetical protein